MRKILLLGGSAQQIVAIQKAKELGYYTVLCDYLPDNPGQNYADRFYQVSTTDKDAVLQVAQTEEIDGILAYASDPAAPTAAYVAEKMGLPGNPMDTVETLCKKDRFREFLQKEGFCTPIAKCYRESEYEQILFDVSQSSIQFPIIIKPVDSSGSKGVTVLQSEDGLKNAIAYAYDFSRCKKIIIETYIEKDHPYLIGGDIYVLEGQIVLFGLMDCHRDTLCNPLVPTGKSFPDSLTVEQQMIAKETLQELVDKVGYQNGPMNIELIVTKNKECYLIDVGPRAGGNMIPDLIHDIFDIDVVELSIKLAMGERIQFDQAIPKPGCWATHNLHSRYKAIFDELVIDDTVKKWIYRTNIYVTPGQRIDYFDNASKALGIIFFHFSDENMQQKVLKNIDRYVKLKCLMFQELH